MTRDCSCNLLTSNLLAMQGTSGTTWMGRSWNDVDGMLKFSKNSAIRNDVDGMLKISKNSAIRIVPNLSLFVRPTRIQICPGARLIYTHLSNLSDACANADRANGDRNDGWTIWTVLSRRTEEGTDRMHSRRCTRTSTRFLNMVSYKFLPDCVQNRLSPAETTSLLQTRNLRPIYAKTTYRIGVAAYRRTPAEYNEIETDRNIRYSPVLIKIISPVFTSIPTIAAATIESFLL